MYSVRTSEVWRPPLDRSVDQDFAVGLRLESYLRMRRSMVRGAVIWGFVLLFDLVVDGTMVGFAVVAGLACLAMIGRYVFFRHRYGRFYAAIRAATARGVPVLTKAEFVGRDVLSLDSGRLYVRLWYVNWGVRQVIARTGEVWLAGQEGDTAVLFADGLPVPLAAAVVDRPEPSEVDAVEAVDGDVTLWWAKRFGQVQWVPVGLFAVLLTGLLVDIAQHTPRWWIPGLLFAGLLGFLVLWGREIIWLSKRFDGGGEWQSYPVEIHMWQANPLLHGDLGLHLTLPDGTGLPVAVRWASTDLLANIQQTGRLWVLGIPNPGFRVVVGVPGYPIVAAARFVRKVRLHG
ncbi:hypothetical protein GCM10029964_043350 [Kibdelosporangium lantanae]